MTSKRILVVVATLVLCLSLVQCEWLRDLFGTKDERTFVGLVVDGEVDDGGWYEDSLNGLLEAQTAFQVEVDYVASTGGNVDDPAHGEAIDTMLQLGRDLICTTSFNMRDATLAAAQSNPSTDFAIVSWVYDGAIPSNLLQTLFRMEQNSFLAGYIAGRVTVTNHVGWVGGMDLPLLDPFKFGFLSGVLQAEVGTSINVDIAYVGSFVDEAGGESAADAMYAGGADIIMHAAGQTGNGVIASAVSNDKYVIGVDVDQRDLAPDNMLTSAVSNPGRLIYLIVESYVNDQFNGGGTYDGTLANGGVGLAPLLDVVLAGVADEVDVLRQAIIDGDLVVPTSQSELDAFVPYGSATMEPLVLWTVESSPRFDWVQDHMETWLAEHGDVTLELTHYVAGDMVDVVVDRHQNGGELPDLIWSVADHTGPLFESGAILPTDSYFTPADVVEVDQYDGEHWSIPVSNGNHLMLFYNKSIIAEEDVPATTEELLALDPADLPAGVDWWLQANWSEPFWVVPFYAGYGGSPFEADGVTVSMNNQAMVDSLNLVKSLVDLGISDFVSSDLGGGYGSVENDLVAGLTAMAINGDWAFEIYRDALGANLGVTRIPEIEGVGWPRPYTSPKILLLPENADPDKLDLAAQLADYLLSYGFQAAMVENWSRLPALLAVAEDGIDDPLMQASADQLSVGTPMPTNSEIHIFWDAFRPPLNDFLGGTGTAAEAATAMQAAADAQQ